MTNREINHWLQSNCEPDRDATSQPELCTNPLLVMFGFDWWTFATNGRGLVAYRKKFKCQDANEAQSKLVCDRLMDVAREKFRCVSFAALRDFVDADVPLDPDFRRPVTIEGGAFDCVLLSKVLPPESDNEVQIAVHHYIGGFCFIMRTTELVAMLAGLAIPNPARTFRAPRKAKV